MSCDQTQYLDAYMDGELAAADRVRVDEHLAACAECARELARLRRLSSLVSGYRPPALSAAALERIHDAIGPTWDLGILSLARRTSAVAAAVVLAGSLYLTFFQADQATAAAVPVWEQAAVSGVPDAQATGATGTGEQAQLAEWIVSDLGGNGASARNGQ